MRSNPQRFVKIYIDVTGKLRAIERERETHWRMRSAFEDEQSWLTLRARRSCRYSGYRNSHLIYRRSLAIKMIPLPQQLVRASRGIDGHTVELYVDLNDQVAFELRISRSRLLITKLANECRRSCSRKSCKPARFLIRSQGKNRCGIGRPVLGAGNTCGLPAILGTILNTSSALLFSWTYRGCPFFDFGTSRVHCSQSIYDHSACVTSLRRAPVRNSSIIAFAAIWFSSARMEARRRAASSLLKYRLR